MPVDGSDPIICGEKLSLLTEVWVCGEAVVLNRWMTREQSGEWLVLEDDGLGRMRIRINSIDAVVVEA